MHYIPTAELTIVIPTFKDAANVELLVEVIANAAAGIDWEVLFVDDHSADGTAERVREITWIDPRVRVVHRYGRHRLSSACVEEIMASAAPYCIVMDAGFQHDERIIPEMFATIRQGQGDIVAVAALSREAGSASGAGAGSPPEWRAG